MASNAEVRVVYAAGVVQGIALVTFPAASTILTDPAEYDLSSTQYGALFLPQVITAIAGALLGAGLASRYVTKRLYLAGLGAGLVSMALLLVSAFVTEDKNAAFVLLLLATGSLGAGFGLTVPALNTLAAAFHPTAAGRAILVLNALLGLGTVLAPLFVALFDGLGFWWGMPLTSATLLVALLLASLLLPLRAETRREASKARGRTAIPSRFWAYAGFAVLYGICETVNGNWSQQEMTSELGGSTALASLALTTFWGMVTLGRVLFAAVQRWIPSRVTYHLLPFVLAAAFGIVALLPDDDATLGVVAFGLAGLGCSALLPLTISFGQEELTAVSAGVAGGVIAFYQLGYGVAAFGVGPVLDAGIDLSDVYAGAAIVALALGAWSFAVARRMSSPASLHPHLGHSS
jgi:fucose permease